MQTNTLLQEKMKKWDEEKSKQEQSFKLELEERRKKLEQEFEEKQKKIDKELLNEKELLRKEKEEFMKEKEKQKQELEQSRIEFEKAKNKVEKLYQEQTGWIKLNVGGQHFGTRDGVLKNASPFFENVLSGRFKIEMDNGG